MGSHVRPRFRIPRYCITSLHTPDVWERANFSGEKLCRIPDQASDRQSGALPKDDVVESVRSQYGSNPLQPNIARHYVLYAFHH